MAVRRLVVSDIDGTLLGDPRGLQRFRDWVDAEGRSFRLVYATGRHPAEVATAVAEEGLPEPDAVIAALGTEILDASGRQQPAWARRFDSSHGDRVRAALRRFPRLTLQPAVHQSTLKASYDALGLTSGELASVGRTLSAAGVRARLVYSAGRFLDVIPGRSGKGAAARFLADRWGRSGADVLAFGDSGNDLDLLSAGFRATIVANALPEVRRAVGPGVYRSPLPYADGVLDGIRYWTASRLPQPEPRRLPRSHRLGRAV